MKKHAAIRIAVAMLCLAYAVAWAILTGPATSGALVRREPLTTLALIWGISAAVAFVIFLTHALRGVLIRDVMALGDVVMLAEHEDLNQKYEALRERHGNLISTHRALGKDHRALRAQHDHLVWQRDFVEELNDEPHGQAVPALEPASAH